jgi:hypothetical protein
MNVGKRGKRIASRIKSVGDDARGERIDYG